MATDDNATQVTRSTRTTEARQATRTDVWETVTDGNTLGDWDLAIAHLVNAGAPPTARLFWWEADAPSGRYNLTAEVVTVLEPALA